jgi:hypothetical protein
MRIFPFLGQRQDLLGDVLLLVEEGQNLPPINVPPLT